MISKSINKSLLSNYNNDKKILRRESNSDEETTSLTSTSSSSNCDEKRTRQRQSLSKCLGKNTNNSNSKYSKWTSNATSIDFHETPMPKEKNRFDNKRTRPQLFLSRGVRREKQTSKATSVKPHDEPMQKKDIHFALDCEMVGVGPEGLDSALARISIVNWDNEVVLDTYVRVQEKVTDYRTFVSGIRQEHIESTSAATLEEVQDTVSKILRGKILIGHGLENDLKAIGISHPWCDIRDTTAYQPYMRQASIIKGEPPIFCPRKLKDLAWEYLGEQIQVMGKAHSPMEDAMATMNLYKAVRAKWEMSVAREVFSSSNPRSIGKTYRQSSDRFPTVEERLGAARIAQQQARIRATAALRYQRMMQSCLQQ